MTFDWPFVSSVSIFKKRHVSDAAIEFLRVGDVPKEWARSQGALLNVFQFQRARSSERFQTLVNVLLYNQLPSTGNAASDAHQLTKDVLGHSELPEVVFRRFRQLLWFTTYYLAMKGVIKIPPVPAFNPGKQEAFFYTPWFSKFPEEVRFWFVAGTQELLNKYAYLACGKLVSATSEWFSSNKVKINTWSNTTSLMRHYFAERSIEKFDLSEFVVNSKAMHVLSETYRSPKHLLEIYSIFFGVNLNARFEEEYSKFTLKLGHFHQVYQDQIVQNRTEMGFSDPYTLSSVAKTTGSGIAKKGKTASRVDRRKLPVELNSKYGVLIRKNGRTYYSLPEGYSKYQIPNQKVLQVGAYTLNLSVISSFDTDLMKDLYPNDWWINHQLDWLENFYEKNTVSNKKHVLKILNAYLFSYLPWFKENEDSSFNVPADIFSFDPNTMIRRTHSFLARHDPNKILPITLPEFVDEVSQLGAPIGVNALSIKHRTILNFFDHIIALEGASIQNPMILAPKVKGYGYAESQKLKIDYEYWKIFQIFLYEFARCACLAAKEFFQSNGSDSASWFDLFRKHASGRVVEFGTVQLRMDEMTGLENFDPETAYIFASLILVVSECGIRFSNALWLDVESFDSRCPVQASNRTDKFELFVNTDKSKLRPYQSYIGFFVFEVLRLVKDIRKPRFSDSSIFYQNNPKSKWGRITPLFRYSDDSFSETMGQELADITLSNLVISFQSLLSKSGYKFDSYIYPSTAGMLYSDYVYFKATRTQALLKDFLIDRQEFYEKEDSGDFGVYPVSLFRYKASMTIHSFRKTFVSFWTIFFSNEDVSKLWTGQAPGVVGYYSSNTIADYEKAHDVARVESIPFSVGQNKKNGAEIVSDLKKNGIGPHLVAINAAEGDSFDLDEEYRVAPDSDIAVNRTHICPHNNQCPAKIRKILDGKKLCGICPAALSFHQDAPAISAKIRQLGDQIADLSLEINSGDLTAGELDDYQHKRMELVAEFSAWGVRHDHLIALTDGEILIGEDGHGNYTQKIKYEKDYADWSEEKRNLWQIFETSQVRTMQSERLKQKARRYARKLILNIDEASLEQIDVDPVKTAALLVQKTAKLQGLTMDQVVRAIEYDSEKPPSVPLLSTFIGDSNDD